MAGTSTQISTRYIITENSENIVIEDFDAVLGGILLLESATSGNVLPLLSSNAPQFDEVVARWEITTRAKPASAITTAISPLEMLGEPVFLELFGVGNDEPYETFKNLWFDHPLPAYRLAGITLAVIYRTEEARING